VVWLLFVYFPFVHMVWGGGMLQKWGVLDFAGGIVVHAIAGMAALASVFFLGRRPPFQMGRRLLQRIFQCLFFASDLLATGYRFFDSKV